MEEYIWRLLTAMFLLLVAAVLAVFAFVFQGAMLIVGICVYGSIGCALIGIVKGLFVIMDYNRAYKEETEE